MNTLAQSPQDLSDLLTARGLQMILQPIPGAQPVSQKSDLNVLIMDRFWLLQYAKPVTDLEIALIKHLKDMDQDYGDKNTREDLEEELKEAQTDNENLHEKVAELNEKQLVLSTQLEEAAAEETRLKEQLAELEEKLMGSLI